MPQLQQGDRVAFARHWLRSTGNFTGDVPFMRGTVEHVHDLGQGLRVVTVAWDARLANGQIGEACTWKALESNLVRLDRIHLESV